VSPDEVNRILKKALTVDVEPAGNGLLWLSLKCGDRHEEITWHGTTEVAHELLRGVGGSCPEKFDRYLDALKAAEVSA